MARMVPEHEASAFLSGTDKPERGYVQQGILPCGCLIMSKSSRPLAEDTLVRDHTFRHIDHIRQSKPHRDPGFVDPTPVETPVLLRSMDVDAKLVSDEHSFMVDKQMAQSRAARKQRRRIDRMKHDAERIMRTPEGTVISLGDNDPEGEEEPPDLEDLYTVREALKDAVVLSKDRTYGELRRQTGARHGKDLPSVKAVRLRPMTPAEFREKQKQIAKYRGKNIDMPEARTNLADDIVPEAPGVVIHERTVDPLSGATVETTSTIIRVEQPVEEIVIDEPVKEVERRERKARRETMGRRRGGRF